MRLNPRLLIPGLALLLVGLLLPRAWYDALPRRAGVPPPPVRGDLPLRLTLLAEGLALVWLARRGARLRPVPAEDRLSPGARAEEGGDLGGRAAFRLLAAVTALGVGLRLWRLDSDLWLDEIATVITFRETPALNLVATYLGFNNHLLNTLLVKLMIAAFGEQEWAIRLPAALFGAATVPAIYWVARLAMSRRASLGAALLLAVSYHHIFFSQNARGYAAYLLLSLLSSGLLVKGLQGDRPRHWALYVVATLLNFASILISGFVFAAHLIVGAAAVVSVRRRGGSPGPLLRRLAGVFSLAALLGFQLYSLIVFDAIFYAGEIYSDPSAGFSIFTAEFFREVIRGTTAGFGTGVLLGALPFVALTGLGFVLFWRRAWAPALALLLPPALTAATLVIFRLAISPRFFLLALPLAMISVVQGIYGLAGLLAGGLGRGGTGLAPRAATAVVLLFCAASLASLKLYYAAPKQDYRAALAYLAAERQPGEAVVVVHLAEAGYRFYGGGLGLKEGEDCFYARSVAALEAGLASHPGRRSWLVTTFPRALRLAHPDLAARVAGGWDIARTFPGTVGDGEVSVWRSREP